MNLEEKIRELVLEVLKKYLRARILVVVTGGRVNADVSIKELKSLKEEQDVAYSLLFTRNAARIHDVEKIAEELGAENVFIDGRDDIDVKEFLKDFKAVVIAVLSRNTAAKVANLFLDSITSQVIVDALMLGIPVIAARDAADPRLKPWQDLGFVWMGEGLKGAFAEVLDRIERYGVMLCGASEIKGEVLRALSGKRKEGERPGPGQGKRVYVDKKVITREDLALLKEGRDEIHIPRGAIITPLAADFIRENALKIIVD